MTRSQGPFVQGSCDERFARVREIFETSFADGTEIGASVCFHIDGERVVDLWGGSCDREGTQPWHADTLANVYSTTKGMTAICAHQLIEQGRVHPEDPVSKHWPEFEQAGKQAVTVAHLLSHRAGLPAIRKPMETEQLFDWEAMTTALAETEPWWTPGERHGYHAVTYGHLVGEVVRRVTGQSVGQYFREQVAEPLGADFYIGLPEELEFRTSPLFGGLMGDRPPRPDGEGAEIPPDLPGPLAQFMRDMRDPTTMTGGAFGNPRMPDGLVNSRAWRAAEIPAANGHASARGVSRIYAALARGGDLDGVHVLAPETIEAAIEERSSGPDAVLGRMPMRFGLGFMLRHDMIPLSPNRRAFGHPGAGGSIGMADPDARVGFGYVMNRMKMGIVGAATAFAMIGAFYDGL